MAVNEPIRVAGPFVGDGSLVELDFDFETFSTSDVTVVVTDADGVEDVLTLNTDYTVALNSGSAGGSVTLLSALATGTTAHVYGDAMTYIRTGNIVSNPGGFFPSVVNAALDRVHIALLQLAALADRGVKAPRGESGVTLPSIADRGGKALGFNVGGAAVAIAIGDNVDTSLRADLADDDPLKGAALIIYNSERDLREKASDIVSVKDFGAVGDGVTNDYAAIIAARNWCWANGNRTLGFPDGVYAFGSTLEMAQDHWACVALGDNVVLKFTGAGVAVTLHGSTVDANYGCYKGKFGGVHSFIIEGNAGCTKLLEVDSYHHGVINVDLREGQNGLVFTDLIGSGISSAAVLTQVKLRISQGNDGLFTTPMTVGFTATKMYACPCELLIEHCATGLAMSNASANVLTGTVEGNTAAGIVVSADSYRNTFVNMFCEANVGRDWDVGGDYNRLVNCTGVDSAGGNRITGDHCVVEGGKFQSLSLTAAAERTVIDGVDVIVAFTDSSSTTTVRGTRLKTDPLTIDPPVAIADYGPAPTAVALTFGANIADYSATDATYQPVVCFRTIAGLNQVMGTFAASGAISVGDTIATVPAGYRPAKRILVTGFNFSTGAAMGFTIDSAGLVQTRTAISSGNVFGFGTYPYARA